MPGSVADEVTVEVVSQGPGLPYQVRLETHAGAHTGSLDLAHLRAALEAAEVGANAHDLQAYGRILFEHLFAGDLAYHFGAALGAAGERGIRLLLNLDPDSRGLGELPWERLYQPQGGGWVPLAAAPNVFFSRYLRTGQPWGLPTVSGKFRILAVIPAPFPPGHPGYFDGSAERRALENLLAPLAGQVECDFLPGPVTLEAIAGALASGRGYDILHYAGHGGWDDARGEACLVLEEPDGSSVRPQVVFEREIVGRLTLNRQLPALIALFACETAGAPAAPAALSWPDPSAGFMGLGPRLVAAGCPAVICMQGRVEDALARRFALQFYTRLLARDGGVVDQAMNRARAAVHEHWAWQWSLPVLFMRLRNGVLFRPEHAAALEERRPYRGLRPYTRAEADLFGGRAAEVAELRGLVAQFPLVVLSAEPGQGLTSLVEAGLRPVLEAEGALAITITSYDHLAQALRAGLAAVGEAAPLRVPGDAPAAHLLRAALAGPFSRVVMFMDQAECILDLPDELQARLMADLTDCLEALGDALRILFATHADAQPGLAVLLRPLCKWPLASISLPPLCRGGALEAVIRPLEVLDWPVTIVPASLAEQIVSDVADLWDNYGRVDPAILQVVWQGLYDRACASHAGRAITEDLYAQARWAEGLVVAHVEETLARLATDRAAAEQCIARIAAARGTGWVGAEQLVGLTEQETRRRVLEPLLAARLLVERRMDGHHAYAFANPVVAKRLTRLQATAGQLAAEGEIDRAWGEWLDRDALATRGQLRYLRYLLNDGAVPRVFALQVLLLLRSAVARREPPDPWLQWACQPETAALIRQLEMPQAPIEPETRVSRSALQRAAQLLATAAPEPGADSATCGAVARAAAAQDASRDEREAAALALTALGPAAAVDRLRWAVAAQLRGWRHRLRHVELRAALVDARPAVAEFRSGLSTFDTVGVWFWRVRRRLARERDLVGALTAGGALGTGVALAGLRFATALLLVQQYEPGLMAAEGLLWGLLLGAALTFGLLLARMLVPGSDGGDEALPVIHARSRRMAAVMLGLGTLVFGLMQAFLALLGGLRGERMLPVILMGFVAGLGLSLAAGMPPVRGRYLSKADWLMRLGFSLSGLVVSHLPFLLPRYAGSSLAIVWAGITYCTNISARLLYGCETRPAVLAGLGLLDAALVGLCLSFGLNVGLLIAGRWLQRWREVSARAGD